MQENEILWLDRAKTGDPEAFGQLVEAYQIPVYNLCYRMLGDHFEAEDAAQEAFIRAFKALGNYDSNRSFSTWLLSIAAHYCIDQIRRRRMSLVSIEDLPYQQVAGTSPGPEDTLILQEDQKRIQALLSSLSPIDRAAVVMRYWHDLSYEEIAESLGITVSAVKSRLHRSRRDLAHLWINQPGQLLSVEGNRHESPAF